MVLILDCSTALTEFLSPAALRAHPPRKWECTVQPCIVETKSHWWELQCNDQDSGSARALFPEPTPKLMKLPFKWWDKIILFILNLSLFFFSPGCSLYLRPLGGNSGKCWQGEQTRCRWHNPEGFARVSDVRNISLLAEVWFIRLKVSHTDSLSSLSFVLPNRSCACDGFPNWRALLHECQQC